MFGPLAGESSMDMYGNVYFTHHYYENDTMLEADIYVAHRKHPLKGVSLTPRNSSSEYFGEFMEKAHEAGGIVRWAADWMHLAGETPITITELGSQYNYSPLIEVSPQSGGALIRELNESVKATYLEAAVNYSAEYQPKYLGLATEINNLYERAWYNLGSIFMEIEPPLLDEASIFLRRAIECDPGYEKARKKLEECRSMMGG